MNDTYIIHYVLYILLDRIMVMYPANVYKKFQYVYTKFVL